MSASIGNFDKHQLEALLQEGYRLTPATLAYKITHGMWVPAKHLLYISTIVSNAIIKGGQFIIVTMPPRHGKSEFLSVNTPIWFLEKFPHQRVILTSYGADLAAEFSLKVRNTFQNEDLRGLLTTRLRKDKQRVDDFKTTEGGGMIAAGIGGTITGKGANLFLIDDYVKNAEEALSETVKEKIWNWFLSTAFTRLEPNATIIVLATRWDKTDLIGMIIEKFAELEALGFDPPTIINLPALARPNDPLGRKVGQALWPERYNERDLERIRVTLGSYWWDAMYQQDPPLSMTGANLGAKLRYIDAADIPHPSHLKSVRAWDLAATEHGGDWTAGPKMHLHKQTGRIYIEDLAHGQWSPKGVEQIVATCAEADGPGTQIWIEQEPGSAGKHLIEHYQSEVLPGFDCKGEKATGPIEVRAQPFLAAVEAGLVYAVRAPWNQKLVAQLDAFPSENDHNDIIAACALGYRKLTKGRFGGIIWGRDRGSRMAPVYRGEPKKKLGGLVWGRR